MAEEQSGGVRNVWLLLIALGLGLVVVIIYNVQIHRVRMEGRGRTLRLLKLTRDMDLNDKIGDEDIEIGAVPRQFEALHETFLGLIAVIRKRCFTLSRSPRYPLTELLTPRAYPLKCVHCFTWNTLFQEFSHGAYGFINLFGVASFHSIAQNFVF